MVKSSLIWTISLMAKIAYIGTRIQLNKNGLNKVTPLSDVIDNHVTKTGRRIKREDSEGFSGKFVWGQRFQRTGDQNPKKCFDACENKTIVYSYCEDEIENWLVTGENDWDYDIGYDVLFGLFYIVFLLYLFVGVSIVSDKFMEAIEVITSMEKTVRIKGRDGEMVIAKTPVWNETVANLTLMALGSSAPEIFLAIIEVCVDEFQAGALGPGTVIGSAAYNFFIITGVCILVVPSNQIKRIEKYRVFLFTCIFSVFAYLWLLLILKGSTPCVVDIWEATVTFIWFPIMVIIAWRLDKHESKLIAARKITVQDASEDLEFSDGTKSHFEDKTVAAFLKEESYRSDSRERHTTPGAGSDVYGGKAASQMAWHHNQRKTQKFKFTNTKLQEFLVQFQAAKKENPTASDEVLLDQVAQQMLNTSRKSRAYYRLVTMGANKQLTAPSNRKKQRRTWNFNRYRSRMALSTMPDDSRTAGTGLGKSDPYPNHFKVRFDPVEYVVLENVGTMQLFVVRLIDKKKDVADFFTKVEYKTVEGTAKAGEDFVATKGSLVFEPGDFIKTIEIKIVNDEVFEDEEYFTVLLTNMVNFSRRRQSRKGAPENRKGEESEVLPCVLSDNDARVIIIDDDHRGIFSFEKDHMTVDEQEGVAILTVRRFRGARAKVDVPYSTDEFTAKPGVDYIHTEGVLHFNDDDVEANIYVPIINRSEYEKTSIFNVSLSEPKTLTSENERIGKRSLSKHERLIDIKGEARLGHRVSCMVTIVENKHFKGQVDFLSEKVTVADVIKEKTWCDQFRDACMVVGDVDEDTGETKQPTRCDYCCHVFTVIWKLVFAVIPPARYCNGWWCFVGSLFGIGFMTWLVKIVATMVGCSTGLKDYVTAITLVALGTSLPDTFASRAAAVADDCADNAIGNVTGSNAVNVFLGIGIAWILGSIVNKTRGCPFTVAPGDIGFSVVLYTGLVILGVLILVCRRLSPNIGGELGGPTKYKVLTAGALFFLWMIYIGVATLAAYKVFEPGF